MSGTARPVVEGLVFDRATPSFPKTMARRVPIAAARKNFAEIVARSGKGERIKLTRYDRTIAVLIPKQHLKDLERCDRDGARVAGATRADVASTRGR